MLNKPMLLNRRYKMELYVGIDLHSNSNYLGIVNEVNKIVFKHRLANDLRKILGVLEPFRQQTQGVVVESTFNWYWLVDGLMDHGYRGHLANSAPI